MKKGCSLKLDRFSINWIYQGLMRVNSYRQITYLSWSRQIAWQTVYIENYEIRIFEFDFQPMLTCMCRVSFLTTLDIYKVYFKCRHIREYKENTCKRWSIPYSLWRKLLRLWTLGFCNLVLLDLYCWWSKELYSQQSSSSWCVSYILGAVHYWLVMY